MPSRPNAAYPWGISRTRWRAESKRCRNKVPLSAETGKMLLAGPYLHVRSFACIASLLPLWSSESKCSCVSVSMTGVLLSKTIQRPNVPLFLQPTNTNEARQIPDRLMNAAGMGFQWVPAAKGIRGHEVIAHSGFSHGVLAHNGFSQ